MSQCLAKRGSLHVTSHKSSVLLSHLWVCVSLCAWTHKNTHVGMDEQLRRHSSACVCALGETDGKVWVTTRGHDTSWHTVGLSPPPPPPPPPPSSIFHPDFSVSPVSPLPSSQQGARVCLCAGAGGAGRLVTHDRGGPELGMCLQGGLAVGGDGKSKGRDTVFTVCPAGTWLSWICLARCSIPHTHTHARTDTLLSTLRQSTPGEEGFLFVLS